MGDNDMDMATAFTTTYQRFAEQYVAKLQRAADTKKPDVGLAYGLMLAMKLCTPKAQWDAWAVEHRGTLEGLGLTWVDVRAFMAHGQVNPEAGGRDDIGEFLRAAQDADTALGDRP
jgi:hypothetical protein